MYSISNDSFGERLSNSNVFINSDISWCLLSSLASRTKSSLNTFVSETLLFFFKTSFALVVIVLLIPAKLATWIPKEPSAIPSMTL